MYADDVALVAESGADFWIPSLIIVMNGASMCVNTKKSKIIMFCSSIGLIQVFSSHIKGLSWSWWITLNILG